MNLRLWILATSTVLISSIANANSVTCNIKNTYPQGTLRHFQTLQVGLQGQEPVKLEAGTPYYEYFLTEREGQLFIHSFESAPQRSYFCGGYREKTVSCFDQQSGVSIYCTRN